MKLLNKIIPYTFVLSLLILGACNEYDNPYPDFQEAVNMRIQLDPDFPTINANDINNAEIRLDLYSENPEDVEKVDLFVEYYNLGQDSTYQRRLLTTINPDNFSNGQLQDVSIPTTELASVFGLNVADFSGGDNFTIYNVTTMEDGRVYPSQVEVNDTTSINNVTPNILNSSATTSFTTSLVVYVACPLPPGFGTGAYTIEQTEGPADPFFGNDFRWGSGEVTISATSPIQRTFTGKYFTFDVSFNFFLICGQVIVPFTSSGIGCGGPGLNWTQRGTITYDDDEEFIITLSENVDGGCGLPAAEDLTIRLTKVN